MRGEFRVQRFGGILEPTPIFIWAGLLTFVYALDIEE